MRNILIKTMGALLCVVVTGCYASKTNMSRDIAVADIVNVNNSDGVNIEEALIIAKYYLLTTLDEPCHSIAGNYNIGNPIYTNKTYKNDYDVIMFEKLGLNFIGDTSLYVNVNYKTGEAICGGTKMQK